MERGPSTSLHQSCLRGAIYDDRRGRRTIRKGIMAFHPGIVSGQRGIGNFVISVLQLLWPSALSHHFSFPKRAKRLLNVLLSFCSNVRMRFGFSQVRRKRLYWQAAHIWALLRLRRRIVVGAIVYCTLFGIGLALATPYAYKAKVTLRVEKIPSDIGSFLSY